MQMLKQDSMGYYNVEIDDETGEIIHDPRRAVTPEVKSQKLKLKRPLKHQLLKVKYDDSDS